MGTPKQLLIWRNRSLLEHAILNARALLDERVILVLGAHAESIQTAIDLSEVTVISNPDWKEGMASSIRAGVQALPVSASAVLILLCDQPLITPLHIYNLLNNWQNTPTLIIASQYHHSLGVPAVFPAEFFAQLLTLKGDRGAKPLLMQYQQHLLKIPLPEAELDIDHAGDFDYLTSHYLTDV